MTTTSSSGIVIRSSTIEIESKISVPEHKISSQKSRQVGITSKKESPKRDPYKVFDE
jgi:hypothetical protein